MEYGYNESAFCGQYIERMSFSQRQNVFILKCNINTFTFIHEFITIYDPFEEYVMHFTLLQLNQPFY